MKSTKRDHRVRTANNQTLPGTFTTGFRRDLHIARDIIRRQRGIRHTGRKGTNT